MSRRLGMLIGIDVIAALIVLAVLLASLPTFVPVQVAKEFFGVSASVLSIVFSVFTAALAVIISSPDDKFVRWLESEGIYRDILFGFKSTLLALFTALVSSIGAFSWTVFQIEAGVRLQHRSGLLIGSTLLAYALVATLLSTLAAIRHAHARADFLRGSV
ncbi:MAG: hypothetical protein IT361_06585 [Gemmatimonadaceae bacterium]|nr:hypothetical protein [Gemmatimonadaceae bacterium]